MSKLDELSNSKIASGVPTVGRVILQQKPKFDSQKPKTILSKIPHWLAVEHVTFGRAHTIVDTVDMRGS